MDPRDTAPVDLSRPPSALPRAITLADPRGVLITGEDALQIDVVPQNANGQTIVVSGELLTEALEVRPFQSQFIANQQLALNTARIPIGSGWLLNVVVNTSTPQTPFGLLYGFIRICRGLGSSALAHTTLAAGYFSDRSDLYWPGGAVGDVLAGAGRTEAFGVGNPAAGADWTYTVFTHQRVKVIAVSALLTTAAAVANRAPRLIIDDGAVTLFEAPAAVAIPASQVVQHSWGAGAGGPVTADNAAAISSPIPNDLFLTGGMRVRTSTGLLQAADQWSNIRLLLQEWVE